MPVYSVSNGAKPVGIGWIERGPAASADAAPAPSDAWRHGVRLFDAGAFWDCHEALEPLWIAAEGSDRHLYAGVIQLAAALHKARQQQQPRGGRRNYAKALGHLGLLPDHYRGVDVRELEARVHRALRSASYSVSIPEGSTDAF